MLRWRSHLQFTADVFASGDRLEDVAAKWAARFNEHEARAVAEIVNLVLRAAGCHLRIDEDDIADPDNAPSRVAEIQEEFQTVSYAQSIKCLHILTDTSTS
jgi:hypothetical protein